MHPAPVIYINGYPETEPFDIVQHLLSLLPQTSLYRPILINNQFNNYNGDDEEAQAHAEFHNSFKSVQTEEYNKEVLFAEPRSTIVMVANCQSTDKKRVEDMVKYRNAVRKSGRVFIPIILKVDTNDIARILKKGETELNISLLTAGGVYAAFMDLRGLLAFGTSEEMVIDVTKLHAGDAAAKIARWVWWVGEFMSWDDDPACEDEKHET